MTPRIFGHALLAMTLFVLTGCPEDPGTGPTPTPEDMTLDVTEDVTPDVSIDMSPDVSPDLSPDMPTEDMPSQDLCDPNPCQEANRSVCEPRGQTVICKCDDGFRDEGGTCVEDAVCDANACIEPNRGVCSDVNGVAVCGCDTDYIERDGACVLEDPCSTNPCSEADRGQCSVSANQTVVCGCDPGFIDDAGVCVPEDPCASNPCMEANKGVCAQEQGAVSCSCDPGFREDDQGACVDADPCDPSPCSAPNQGTCEADPQDASVAVCLCDVGFQEDAQGACVLIPPPMCNNQHTSGDMYEPDECVALATPIAAGQSQSHTIEPAGDRDFYALTPQAGEILRFQETTNLDAYFFLYDTDGQTILRQGDSEDWRWEFDTAGTYYLLVRHFSSSRTGSYELSVTSLGFDDHGDLPSEATIAMSGSPLIGEVEVPGDKDYFSFTPQAGHIYEFKETTSLDVYFFLLDTDGQTVLRQGDSETWRWEFDTAGTYFIQVRNFSSSRIGAYSVDVTDLGLDDHGDDWGDATVWQPGQTILGDVETPGDRDYFSFTAQAGHVYRIEETTTFDASLTLRDGQGNILRTQTTDWMQWEFTTGGTYFVGLRNASSSRIGAYEFVLTDLGVDDAGDTTASAGASTPLVMGVFETFQDRDVYSFTITQPGQIYYIAETTSTDVTMTLYDTDGQAVLETASSPEWFARRFDTPGTYFVSVRHASSTRIGTYELTFEDRGLDDHSNGPTSATSIAVDGMDKLGSLEYRGDTDWFSFTTTAGNVYAIEVAGSTQFEATLYASDGATSIETVRNGTMFPTLTAGTTYYVEVKTRSSNSIGAFTLSVDD